MLVIRNLNLFSVPFWTSLSFLAGNWATRVIWREIATVVETEAFNLEKKTRFYCLIKNSSGMILRFEDRELEREWQRARVNRQRS